MDKQKKEVTLDFDLYVKENKETFQKGISQGYSYAMKAVTVYLNKKCHIRELLTGEYSNDWQSLMKALGREEEWNEFIEERKSQEQAVQTQPNPKKEEECQQPQ